MGFEMASDSSINFSKSKVIGLNLKQGSLEAASTFLACDIYSVPFQFLGISVGVNLRRRSTWSSLLDKLRNRLSKWKGKHISMDGCVTLFNSILNSIPIYSLSFYKAPKCFIQTSLGFNVISLGVVIRRKGKWRGLGGISCANRKTKVDNE